MRIRNKEFAENLIHHIRLYFSQSGFYFKDPSQVKVISGQEEGLLSFIAANYFQPGQTKGILDLGGASTQIAFIPSSKILFIKLTRF